MASPASNLTTGNLTVTMANATVTEVAMAEVLAQLAAVEAEWVTVAARVKSIMQLTTGIWRIMAAFIVLFMQLGFSLIEAGTVRYKNTRNIMIKNVLDMCVSAIAFWLIGFAIGFGGGSDFVGWETPSGSVALAVVPHESGSLFFFNFVFCATSATIFAGAVAERTQITAYLFFNFFLAAIIYPVIAHIIWSHHGLLSADAGDHVLGTRGVLDNAGSMVVHVTGGVTSLVAAWMVGPRIGRFDIDGRVVPFRGHSLVFIAAGTIILWVGFFGFNGGSVQYLGQPASVWVADVARVCANTTVCAAFAGVAVWFLTYWRKEPNLEDTLNGVIGGLVAACATSSIVEAYAACIIGAVAGAVYLVGVHLVNKARIDDPVNATAVHLCCGTWGSLAVGFFASPAAVQRTYQFTEPVPCGLFYGCGGSQLLVQIIGLLLVYAWVGLTSFVLFFALHYFDVLRVKRHEEEVGLDVAFHGGNDDDEAFDVAEDGDSMARRLLTWRKLQQVSTLFARAAARNTSRQNGYGSAGAAGKGGKGGRGGLTQLAQTLNLPGLNVHERQARRAVWHKSLEGTHLGRFSLAMYEANYIMEDTVEVQSSSRGVFIGIHDGHNGSEAAEFLRETLYNNIIRECNEGNGVSVEALRRGFDSTERQLAAIVREAFEESPHLAMVGACSVAALITPSAIWVANVGDCRAVLGQVRQVADGIECRAVQLSTDHNLSVPAIREKYIAEHADMPDAVVERRGRFRVKGKVMVTKAFGDLYLKSTDFNREPLVSRFRVPEPFNPPLISADPTVAVRVFSPHDSFVIVASDGLFEFLSNQEAVNIVASSPKKDVARQLIRTALQRAAEKTEMPYNDLLRMPSGQRRDYHDDISVVVFFLDHDAMRRSTRSFWKKDVSIKGGSAASSLLAPPTISGADVHNITSLHGATSARDALAEARAQQGERLAQGSGSWDLGSVEGDTVNGGSGRSKGDGGESVFARVGGSGSSRGGVWREEDRSMSGSRYADALVGLTVPEDTAVDVSQLGPASSFADVSSTALLD
ncbi:hypothetical protein CLOM_g870 [Closterium sp. NIES-68]|nr:hypothetical protein CLOM_g870 [Closterium sp. NIES-68]GJP65920.1 hypothetical protein CLOP_g22818 [Closterium sp. NIES-67]